MHVEGDSHFHFTHGWVCNIIFTLPGTSDYYVQNILNIRIALSVIGEESICSHLRFWGFSIVSVSAKTGGSDETVWVQRWLETPKTVFPQRGSFLYHIGSKLKHADETAQLH